MTPCRSIYGETTPGTSTSRRYVPDVLQLAHTASSSYGAIGHGTPWGRPVMYRIRSMFCFFGMEVGKLRPNTGRISILGLRRTNATSRDVARRWRDRVGEGHTIPQLGSALLARAMPWLHDGRLDELLKVCRDAATTVFGSPRKGDQYGTLAAGVWLLLADHVPNRPEATSWLRKLVK